MNQPTATSDNRTLAGASAHTRRTRAAAIGLLLVSTGVAVIGMEMLARLVVHEGDYLLATTVPDPVLGFRIEGDTNGHDRWGFRNLAVPSTVDIVAVGDSQTYGLSATRAASWPAQLEQMTARSVYNIGLGGYGPLEYLELTRTKVRQLAPSHVVVGLYFGNDFYDAYVTAHTRRHWHRWRRTAAANATSGEGMVRSNRSLGGLRDWLSQNSVVYGMAKLVIGSWWRRLNAGADVDAQLFGWSDPNASGATTVFTPALRLSVLDTNRPQVAEGIAITKSALEALAQEAAAFGAALTVLLIPTKEQVYCDHLISLDEPPPEAFTRLCSREAQVRSDITDVMDQLGIRYADTTTALRKAAARGAQLYPQTDDGHPNATGYRVIAEHAAGALAR